MRHSLDPHITRLRTQFMRSHNTPSQLQELLAETLDILEETQKECTIYRHIFEDSSVIKLLVDARSYRIVRANQAAIAFYGYPAATLLGYSLADLMPATTLLDPAQRYQVTQHRLASGVWHDVEMLLSNPVEIDEQPHIALIVRDITNRRRAETQLEHSHQIQFTLNVLLEIALSDDPFDARLRASLEIVRSVPTMPAITHAALWLATPNGPQLAARVGPDDPLCTCTDVGTLFAAEPGLPPQFEPHADSPEKPAHYTLPIVLDDALLGVILLYTLSADDPAPLDLFFVEPAINILAGLIQRELTHSELRQARAELEQRVATRTAELAQAEARYRTVSEIVSDYAYSLYVEQDGSFVREWVTEAFTHITGYQPAEIPAHEVWSKLIHPDDLRAARHHLQFQLFGQSNISEYRIVTKTGKERWVRDYGRPIWDETGTNVVRIIGAVQDVTDQKRAEAMLEQLMRSLGARIKELDCLYTIAHLAEDPTLDLEDVLARAVDLLPHALQYPEIACARAEVQGQVYATENFGTPACQQTAAIVVRGTVIGSLSAGYVQAPPDEPFTKEEHQLLKAVAERLARLVEIRQSETALRESERRYRALFDSAADGIYVHDMDQRFLDVNQRACDMLGYTRAELMAAGSQAITAPGTHESTFQTMQQRKDGSTLPVEVHSRAIEYSGEPAILSLARDITERVRAEQALHERENQLRLVTGAMMDVVFHVSVKGLIAYASPSCQSLLGYEPEELQGHSFYAYMPPDSITQVEGAVRTTGRVQHRLRHADGHYVWVETLSNFLLGEEGDVQGIVLVSRDITERRQAAQALRESEEKLRAQYKGIPMPTYTWQRSGDDFVLIDTNEAALTFTQGAAANQIGTRASNLYNAPEIQYEMTRCFFNQSRGEQAVHHWIKTGDKPRLLALRFAFVPPDLVLVHTEDITDRQHAEDALRESEERFRRTFDQSPIGAALTSLDHNFVRVNTTLCKITGYSEDELMASTFTAIMHPDDVDDVMAATQRLIAGSSDHIDINKRYIHKNGGVIWMHISIRMMTDAHGQPLYFLPMMEDITERLQAEEALHRTQRDLRVRNQIASAFLTTPDNEIFDQVLQIVLSALDSEHGIFGYIDAEGNLACPAITHVVAGHPLPRPVVISTEVWEQIWQTPLHVKKTLYRNRPFNAPNDHTRIVRAMSVPLVHQDQLVGVLLVANKATDYNQDDVQLIESVAAHIAPILQARLERDREEQERRRAEDELHKLSRAIEQTADQIIITNVDGVIEYVNPAFETLTGFALDEMVGQTPNMLNSNTHPPAFYDKLWRTIQGGNVFRAVFVNRKKNGDIFYEEKTITPLRNTQDEITHFVSTGKDITARKAAEADIRARAQQQTTLAELARFALVSSDLPTLMHNATEAVRRTLNVEYADVLEYLPGESNLILRASTGWEKQGGNRPSFPIDAGSLVQYIIESEAPVLVTDLSSETRFHPPQTYLERGVTSCIITTIPGESLPFGIIGAHATTTRQFTIDEIHFLRLTADVLAQAIERKRAELAEREQRTLAVALRESVAALNRTLNLDEVLTQILANIERVVPHDAANVMLVEDEVASVVGQSGYPNHQRARWPLAEAPVLRRMAVTSEPVIISNIDQQSILAFTPETRSYLGAPIRHQDQVIGFLNLDSRTPGYYSAIHAEQLQAFADHAAVAIQNARLYEHSRALAALEERQRLARELHDAVSQTLFSASVLAEALPRLWDFDPKSVQEGLGELHLLTRGAMAEMRTLLLELRPSALIDTQLADLLRQLTEAFAARTRIEVKLDITGEQPVLPDEAKLALYRIVQEALNNISKHARAQHVTVHLHSMPDQVALRIIDNGRGFEPDQVAPDRMGLKIMAERARNTGAELEITSTPGTGTEIIALWGW